MPEIDLKPSQIFFLHDTIDCRFRNGTHILDTFGELLYKKKNPSAIRKIGVYNSNGKWRVYAGNRRLYIFRKLESLGVVDEITVWEVERVKPDVLKKKDTTENGGTSVEIRNDPAFDEKIKCIINEWRNSNRQGTWTDSHESIRENVLLDYNSDKDRNENFALRTTFHGQQDPTPIHTPYHNLIQVSEASYSHGVQEIKTARDELSESSIKSRVSEESTHTPEDTVIHVSAASHQCKGEEVETARQENTDSSICSLQIASQQPIYIPDSAIHVKEASPSDGMPEAEKAVYENNSPQSPHNLHLASHELTRKSDQCEINVGAPSHGFR
ncbi:uncharacterized protein LOC144361010, partial [Saccoglossus kowalevskii]